MRLDRRHALQLDYEAMSPEERACAAIEALIAEHREAEDTVRFEAMTPKFIEQARAARVFVDAGAEFGFYAFLALREMQEPQAIHLIEPEPARYRALGRRMARFPRVTVHALALGDRSGELELHKASEGTSATLDRNISEHAGATSQWRFRVPMVPLDALLPDQRIDLIKMDIEGAELLALFGMRRILEQDRPRIFLEKHRKFIEAIDPEGVHKLVRLLVEHDYRIHACKGSSLETVEGWIPGRAYLCPRELSP